MFTGIIQTEGKIMSLRRIASGYKMSLKPKTGIKLALGDSIAVNGVCLTVAEIGRDSYLFDISSETAAKTTLREFRTGIDVNLEQAMKAQDMFGGHMVSGHVDGVGKVVSVKKEQADTRIRIKPPENVKEYIVEQGSIAVDGVSLTVARINVDKSFDVVLIPFTLSETNLKSLRPGTKVNMEADMVGKYVKKYVDEQLKNSMITVKPNRKRNSDF
jgi:riboflavin synthase